MNLAQQARRNESEGMSPKIVVSVWPGIGDVVFVTPVFRILRKKFPSAWITALCWSDSGKELLSPSPYIDEIVNGSFRSILTLIPKLKGYNYGIQCSHPVQFLFILCGIKHRISFNGNPFWWLYPAGDNNFHSTEYYLRTVDKLDGVKIRDNIGWEIFIPKEADRFAQIILKDTSSPRIVIHPGARCNKNKLWGEHNFVKLCDSLANQFNCQIVLVGGPEDIELCRYIQTHTKARSLNLAGTTSLLQLAAVIKHCDLFVGHSSGPTHIAAAVGTPVVAIYGPDNPVNFGPLGNRVEVVTPKLNCAPCLHFYRNFFWGLSLRYNPTCKAMQTIKVKEVFDACGRVLSQL